MFVFLEELLLAYVLWFSVYSSLVVMFVIFVGGCLQGVWLIYAPICVHNAHGTNSRTPEQAEQCDDPDSWSTLSIPLS